MEDGISSGRGTGPLPNHIEDTVKSIGQLHAAHEQDASLVQRTVERVTKAAGRPAFIAVLGLLVLSWIVFNVSLIASGRRPLDEPPFFWLQGMVALTALFMTVLILTTQRREDELTGTRDQLTLELAILSEQKSAKIIALLEELRRDDPHITDRHDADAAALSTPADPGAVIHALKETQAASGSVEISVVD